MKSNITFLSDNYDHSNDTKSKILKELKESFNSNYSFSIKNIFYYNLLIYCKYLIEITGFDAMKIINGDVNETDKLLSLFNKKEIEYYDKRTINNFKNDFKKYKLYELLKEIIFEDYYIEIFSDRVLENYIDQNKKYLFIGMPSKYVNNSNVDIYFDTRKITPKQTSWNLLDKIQGIKRSYFTRNSKIKDIYDTIIIFSNNKEILDIVYSNDYTQFLSQFKSSNLLIITEYENISSNKLNNNNYLSKISKIIIDKNKIYMILKNEANTLINIQNICELKDKQIKKTISSSNGIEDISINVPIDTIMKNNYRIGFNIYNKKPLKNKDKHILDIIDENEEISARIEKIGKIISTEIDKMRIK
jgi:hypothetical protein